ALPGRGPGDAGTPAAPRPRAARPPGDVRCRARGDARARRARPVAGRQPAPSRSRRDRAGHERHGPGATGGGGAGHRAGAPGVPRAARPASGARAGMRRPGGGAGARPGSDPERAGAPGLERAWGSTRVPPASRSGGSVVRGCGGALSGWEVRGREHVPGTGAVIVAANHISFWDPLLVGTAAMREQHFLAKGELFDTPILGPLIRAFNAIPIRRGVADLSGLARAMDVLRAGRSLILFPEGTRARGGELRPARPGLGMLAVATDARIVPASIVGSDRPRKWLLHQ